MLIHRQDSDDWYNLIKIDGLRDDDHQSTPVYFHSYQSQKLKDHVRTLF